MEIMYTPDMDVTTEAEAGVVQNKLRKAGGDKETILFKNVHRKCSYANSLILAQWNWFWTFFIQNYEKIIFVFLKTLTLQNLHKITKVMLFSFFFTFFTQITKL